MATLDRWSQYVANFCAWIGGIAIVVMMVHVSADAVMKFMLNKPIPATLELVASYYMVAVIFLPLGIVTMQKRHIEVEIFYDMASKRVQIIFTAVALIISVVYVGLLAWRTLMEALHATRIGESWQTATFDMATWPSRWFVVVGCSLALLFLVLQMCQAIAAVVRRDD